MYKGAINRGIHEECGVFGIYSPKLADLAPLVSFGLHALQHRGQESAGIALNNDGVFRSCRDVGLVSEVFSREKLNALGQGHIAVAHVRYATTGADNLRNVQPLLINHHTGSMALAHNGNLVNSYLTLEPVRLLTGREDGFCTACFGGSYPTEVPKHTSKSHFETKIHESGES